MEWLTRHDPTGESSRRLPSPPAPGLLWEEGRKGEKAVVHEESRGLARRRQTRGS